MYSNRNTADPPSLVPAIIFGVWISVKPCACSVSRNSRQTDDWSRKMALLAGVRRSKVRKLRRVSCATRASWGFASRSFSDLEASSIVKGRRASTTLDTQNTDVTWISTVVCVQPSTASDSGLTTIPSTSTMDSLGREETYLIIPLLTVLSSTNNVHCTVDTRSRSTTNADFPFERTLCTRARKRTDVPILSSFSSSTFVHLRSVTHTD
mmetsp:Transcript_24929/g.41709  ORF Transcript_24929/g.41709 Transcript_24929/m.41709 type:complete len:209 (+) Transcript_24929:559-1185(+)